LTTVDLEDRYDPLESGRGASTHLAHRLGRRGLDTWKHVSSPGMTIERRYRASTLTSSGVMRLPLSRSIGRLRLLTVDVAHVAMPTGLQLHG
jgi:hypothetical protein